MNPFLAIWYGFGTYLGLRVLDWHDSTGAPMPTWLTIWIAVVLGIGCSLTFPRGDR